MHQTNLVRGAQRHGHRLGIERIHLRQQRLTRREAHLRAEEVHHARGLGLNGLAGGIIAVLIGLLARRARVVPACKRRQPLFRRCAPCCRQSR